MQAVTTTIHNRPERIFAQVFSYLLHPLFVPAALAAWLLFKHPLYTLLLDDQTRVRLLAMVSINTILFPVVIAFLLWRLGFIKDLHLDTQRERIFPLVANIIFYFWAWNVSRNLENIPVPLIQWLLGVFLTSCAAMFNNIFMKISLHTLAMGGLITFSILMMIHDPFWPVWMLPLTLIAGGLTGTVRLLREAHTQSEIYAGYLAGAMCMVAGWYIAG
jgi:hypothetical protein